MFLSELSLFFRHFYLFANQNHAGLNLEGYVKIIWDLNPGPTSFLPITPSVLTGSGLGVSRVDRSGFGG